MTDVSLTDELKAAAWCGTPVLEALQVARKSIACEPFDFSSWTQCTCGHIYAASAGDPALPWTAATKVHSPESAPYLAVLKAVIAANDLPIHWSIPADNPTRFALAISHATNSNADDVFLKEALTSEQRNSEYLDECRVQAALDLIDNTIKYVQAQHEQARLDVLTQAKKVVDDAPAKELVPA